MSEQSATRGDERRRSTGILSLTAAELQALRRPMSSSREAAIQATRQHNLTVIRRLLHENGPQSRPELAALSGLSLPTVGALVAELIESGIVHDVGVPLRAKVGKPASRVAIDARSNVAIVLDLTPDGAFVGAAVDLDGTVVDRARIETGELHGADDVEVVVALAKTLLERASAQVVGIGIASPGLVDDDGAVLVSDRLRWRDVPLAQHVTERTGVATVVGNDVNLLARGLSRFRERDGRDALLVALDSGVGGAVLISGRPVIGEQFAAGEIAHLTVDPDGEQCPCGRRGCLDMVVGAPHLQRRRAELGDGVLKPAGRVLGEVLAPIAIMLNINMVVVLGPAELVEGAFADGVSSGINSRLRPAIVAGLDVEVTSHDADLALLGAAAMVMEDQLGIG